MDKKEISRLEELSKQDFLCPNVNCLHYQEYNQCYNHSHVICPIHEEFYRRKDCGSRRED